jgi:serine/threonine protein kinase
VAKKIGCGSQGSVVSGLDLNNFEKVAIKIVISISKKQFKKKERFENEKVILELVKGIIGN